jgi:hypothetical protein
MTKRRTVSIDHSHEPATETYDGFLSKEDKGSLNALSDRKPAYDSLIDATGDPTGFTNNQNIGVSYDPTTRRVTLTGTFEAYYKGVKLQEMIDGWVSEPHADVAGNYFLYYCDLGWQFNTTPWEFSCLMVVFIQYNAHDIGIREVHGFMPHVVHEELHRVIGSYKYSGGDFTGFVLNSTTTSERRPNVSDTVVQDEDLRSTVLALSTKLYTQRYLTGSAVRAFNLGASDIIPLSGSQPYWNENVAGTWRQTLFANNTYGAIFVVALPTTSDAGSQAYRYMFVQPQRNSASLAEIQALTPNDLTHGDSSSLVSEFVFFGKIIIRYTGGNWSITQVDKLDGTKVSQISSSAGNYLSSVSHDTTLTGDGTATNPLSVANDGHTHDGRYYTEAEITAFLASKQATLVSGTNIKTINGASVLGSGDLSVSATVDWSQVFDDSSTYRQYMAKGGSPTGYMRTPSNGLIPSSNGSGDVGTSTWRFASMYANGFFQGSGLQPVLSVAGAETTNPRTLKMSDGTIYKWGTITTSNLTCSTAVGGLYRLASDQTLTFNTSFAFSVEPTVIVMLKYGSGYMWAVLRSASTTNFTYNILSSVSVTSGVPWQLRYFAIGR